MNHPAAHARQPRGRTALELLPKDSEDEKADDQPAHEVCNGDAVIITFDIPMPVVQLICGERVNQQVEGEHWRAFFERDAER